ncbi:hybrid sensor histidine kinase/response regulator [Haloarchaeobius litoreus]|uniref:histidine kinase n=1 Tax=Haloarchaeobius litoreus TaxID=755306 RepID=A0ABD6DHL0_9EURY|nr:PAS domain S-box protein [Haloarchaeobius litoreus]
MTGGGFGDGVLHPRNEGRIRVLHVDDDVQFRDLTKTFLEQLRDEFEVTSFADPTIAIEHVDEFDCVVSDYQMPDVDGLDFLSLVREHDDSIPFVLFTGQGSEEIASEAISAGVTDYIQKEGSRDQYEVLANRIENVVARHRSEQRLRDSERRYRELADASPVPMGIHVPDDGIIYVNDAAVEFFGADSAEAVLGRSPISLMHPDDRSTVAERIGSLFEDGEALPGEPERFVGLDGEVRTGIVSAVPTTVEGRTAAHVVVNDISSYLDAKARISAQQSLVQTIIDTLDDMVYVFEDDRLIRWNERVAEVTGYDDAALASMSPLDFVAAADIEDAAAYVERISEDGRATGTFELETADGDRRPFEFEGFCVEADGTEFRVGIAREPRSEDRRLEEYRKLVEAVGDPMYLLDDEGTIETANEAMADILGISKQAVIGEHASSFMTDGDFVCGTALVSEVLSDPDRTSGTYEFTVARPDGGRIAVEDNVTPLLDERGNYVGSVGVIRDISERKRRENELERQNERLDEFASVLSHDLRNPLNVAQATVENMASDSEDRGGQLDVLRESHQRMADIVEDALTLAREGASVTEPTETRLDEVAGAAVSGVDTAGHAVEVRADATIVADEPRLQRLLENLVRNAVEHGGATVRIDASTDPETGMVTVSVADDGPGIPESEESSVFDSGYTNSETGTGFGLAIVRQLAEAHGWSVTVEESELGGARIEIAGVTPA